MSGPPGMGKTLMACAVVHGNHEQDGRVRVI
jgi:ATP-dependent 26S proteasome regulatory subunit